MSSSSMWLPRAAPKRKSAVLIPTAEGSSRDLTSWARFAKIESTVSGRKPPGLHVYYGSFAAGVGMDATTPSSSDPRELPTRSVEALPRAIRLAIVHPTYRELEAGDGLFWKNAILLTKRGTRSGAARLGS